MSLQLAIAIGTTDTVLNIVGQITNASGPGVITIESEQIAYVGNSVNQFLGLTRGYNSTTPAAHAVDTVLTYVTNEPVGIGDLNGTLPVNVSGGTGILVGGSATISMPAATDSVSGYMTSADHTKLSGTLPLTGGTLTGNLSIAKSGNITLMMTAGAAHSSIIVDTSGDLFLGNGTSNSVVVVQPANSGNPTYFQKDGSVTVNDTTDYPSAVLVASDTTRGFLPPRMTNTQRDAISSPAEGLTVYSTTDHALEFYNGTTWKVVATV